MAVVTIGNFDGVHAGHQQLLRTANQIAAQTGLPLRALTFEPHPRSVLCPEQPLHRLMTPEEKIAVLLAHGVSEVVVIPFDLTFAKRTPADFIQSVLLDTLAAQWVVIGQDFRFGHNAAGNPETLQACPAFRTHIEPLHLDASGTAYASRRLRPPTA